MQKLLYRTQPAMEQKPSPRSLQLKFKSSGDGEKDDNHSLHLFELTFYMKTLKHSKSIPFLKMPLMQQFAKFRFLTRNPCASARKPPIGSCQILASMLDPTGNLTWRVQDRMLSSRTSPVVGPFRGKRSEVTSKLFFSESPLPLPVLSLPWIPSMFQNSI